MANEDVIYENFPTQKVQTKVDFRKRCVSSTCAVVCLGVLCSILLAGNIALIVIYVMNASPGLLNNQLQANSDCEIGWTKFNGSCYIVSSAKKRWTESRDDCKDRGADLVIIQNKDEQAFISGLLRSNEHAWIGFTNEWTTEWEWTWKWVDETPVASTFWQPSIFSRFRRHCGELIQTSSTGDWNDVPCSSDNVWICEKNKMNKL